MRPLKTLVLVVFVSWLSASTLCASEESEALARGAAHVQKTCVGCHAGSQLDVVVSRRLDPLDLKPLSAFLATHHVREDSLREDVIAYLRTRLTTASQEP